VSRLTGERPVEGVTPDSILAIHAAGYRAVRDRLGDGEGKVLDLGCGTGFESARFAREGRHVLGVDYERRALGEARARFGPGCATAGAGASTTAGASGGSHASLHVACMRAEQLGLTAGAVDWLCSSHLVEHFDDPGAHVAEAARVLSATGSAFFLTPNAPADFENPYHVHLFGPAELGALLSVHFAEVEVLGLEASPRARADLAARRARARRILALDVFGLRRRLPRSWYQRAYATLLPLAYRLVARGDVAGGSGVTADDFFVSSEITDETPVLLAVVGRPRR